MLICSPTWQISRCQIQRLQAASPKCDGSTSKGLRSLVGDNGYNVLPASATLTLTLVHLYLHFIHPILVHYPCTYLIRCVTKTNDNSFYWIYEGTTVIPNTATQVETNHGMENITPCSRPVNQPNLPYRGQEADVGGYGPTFIGPGHTQDQGPAPFPGDAGLWYRGASVVPLCAPLPASSLFQPTLGALPLQTPPTPFIQTPQAQHWIQDLNTSEFPRI